MSSGSVQIAFPSILEASGRPETKDIINSMTNEEKNNPIIIGESARKRIAKGAGVKESNVKALLKQLKQPSIVLDVNYFVDQDILVLRLKLAIRGLYIENASLEKRLKSKVDYARTFEMYVHAAKKVVEKTYKELANDKQFENEFRARRLARQSVNEILEQWSKLNS